MTPLDHAVAEVERAVFDGECSIPTMVQGSLFGSTFIEPDPRRLKDKEVVGVAEPVIDDDAFDIGETILDKRGQKPPPQA